MIVSRVHRGARNRDDPKCHFLTHSRQALAWQLLRTCPQYPQQTAAVASRHCFPEYTTLIYDDRRCFRTPSCSCSLASLLQLPPSFMSLLTPMISTWRRPSRIPCSLECSRFGEHHVLANALLFRFPPSRARTSRRGARICLFPSGPHEHDSAREGAYARGFLFLLKIDLFGSVWATKE